MTTLDFRTPEKRTAKKSGLSRTDRLIILATLAFIISASGYFSLKNKSTSSSFNLASQEIVWEADSH